MDTGMIASVYEYGAWANERLLAEYRSEIAAMLTDAGHSPGDLDYLLFCLTRK